MSTWESTQHKYRKKIIVNSSKFQSNNYGFQFRVKIENDGDLALYAKEDGSDILFKNAAGNTQVSQIVFFDKLSGTCIADFRDTITNTDEEIYMYFGSDTYTNNTGSPYTNFDLVKDFTERDFRELQSPSSQWNTNGQNTLEVEGVFEDNDILNKGDSILGYGIGLDLGGNKGFVVGTHQYSSDEIMLDAWVYVNSYTDARILCQAYDTSPQNHDFALQIQNNKIAARLRTDTTAAVTYYSNTDVSLGQWHHIGWYWNSADKILRFYLDGQPDGTAIVNGNKAISFFGSAYPGLVETTIGMAQDFNGNRSRYFDGRIAQVRLSYDTTVKSNWIPDSYNMVTDPTTIQVFDTEVREDLIAPVSGWRTDYVKWEERLKVFIKKEEIIGNETLIRFPFFLNVYNPCLNNASPYGNDIIITDKKGEVLPFERHIFRQNVNQQRYSGAYAVELSGTARLIEDTNAEGHFRAGYLSGIGNSIRYNNVNIFNGGTHDLVIRYSNGWTTTQAVDVIVNGKSFVVSMPSTGSWSIYQTVTISVDNWIQGSNNYVEIGSVTSSPDIDWIQPQGQESTQLKGFVLLPEIVPGEDTELNIYFNNPEAPMRINPAMNETPFVIQAENFNIVSGFATGDTFAPATSGGSLSLFPTASINGEANIVFNKASGFYDLLTEYFPENDGDNSFSIEVNGVEVDSWIAKQLNGPSIQLEKHLSDNIWINNGDTITVKATGNGYNTWGRWGQMDFKPTLLDPNPTWTPQEVWQDYEAVWHFMETPGDGVPFYDYSPNKRHVIGYNMNSGTNDIKSSIGAGIKHIDDNDIVRGTFSPMNLSDDDFTISLWYQRYDVTKADEGIFVSDNMNLRIDNQDELKWRFGDETKISNEPILLDDSYFQKATLVFDVNTNTREMRINGQTYVTDVDNNNNSGLNDSITFGRHRSEDDLVNADSQWFNAGYAEVRIKKWSQSLFNDLNETKNITYPQQYVDYSEIICERNFKEFETIGSGRTETDGQVNKTIEFERDNSVKAKMSNEDSFGFISIERESFGSISVSGEDVESVFLIERISKVEISSQTDTIAGINWIIEFVRVYTGGILSGGSVSEGDEVSFIPDATGSLSPSKIDTSHVIDDGFTLDVYFEDAIGGRLLGGGAVVNNITHFINDVSGGISYVKDSNEIVENDYIEITPLMEVKASGDVDTNNHTVDYTDPDDEAHALILYPTEVHHRPTYIDTYTINLYSSGTSQEDNENIFIPDIEVSGIAFSSGDVDTNSHTVDYTDPSDFAELVLFGSPVPNNFNVYNDSNYLVSVGIDGDVDLLNHKIIYVDITDHSFGTFSNGIEAEHTVEYHPIHLQLINISSNVTADYNDYDATVSGSVRWGKIEASQEIGDGFTLRITITDAFDGGVVFGGTSSHSIEYYPISSGSVKTEVDSVVEANYNEEFSTYTIEVDVLENTESIEYIEDNDYASISVDVSKETTLEITHTTEDKKILTAGIAYYFADYGTESIVEVNVSGSADNTVFYYEDFIGSIEINSKESKDKELIYIPEPSGIIQLTGGSLREVEFNFGATEGTVKTEISHELLLDFFAKGLLLVDINIEENTEEVNYYDSNYYGVIKSNSSAPVSLKTYYINTDWCIKGRVELINDAPYPSDLDLWDIYYVENNAISNWWQVRPSGNFEPISNPLSRSGVNGVYNSLEDLPATGSIGDVWQVGPCQDQAYYFWNGTEWERDNNYPSVLRFSYVSNVSVKLKGSSVNVSNYTTEETTGIVKTEADTTIKSFYNSTVDSGVISLSGNHDENSFEIESSGGTTIKVRISNEDTIPSISRNNESILRVSLFGTSKKSISYFTGIRTLNSIITGVAAEKVSYGPLVEKETLSLSGEVPKPDEVIYSVDSPTIGYLVGSAEADLVDFNTSDVYSSDPISLTNEEIELENVYNQISDFAQPVITDKTENTIEFNILSNYLLVVSGEVDADETNFLKEINGLIKTEAISEDREAEYEAGVSGGINWSKEISSNISVETDKLLVSFVSSGRINVSNYYLEPVANYIGIEMDVQTKTSVSSNTKIDFSNPSYDSGSISISGIVPVDFVRYSYFDEDIYSISIYSGQENTVVYGSTNGTVGLKTADSTTHTVVYENDSFEYSIKIADTTEDPDRVEYFTRIPNKRIVLGGEPVLYIERETEIETNEILTLGSFDDRVIYNPETQFPILASFDGNSFENVYSAITIITPRKIIISGTCGISVDYNYENDFAFAEIKSSSVDYIEYKDPSTEALAKINRTEAPYEFEIVRDFIGGIEILGGVDYEESGQVYFTYVGGGISVSGIAETEQERIFRYEYYKTGVVKISSETEYETSNDYVYELIDGGIKLVGNFLDPVEFYQTYTGLINVFGRSISRLRYGHEVSISTVKVSVFDPDKTFYSQSHLFFAQTDFAKVNISGSGEYEYIPAFENESDFSEINLSSNADVEYYTIFVIDNILKIRVNSSADYESSYDHISQQEVEQIFTSGEGDYHQAYINEGIGGVQTYGDDVTVEEFEVNYIPLSGGITWGKGTIVDPLDYNEFLNLDYGEHTVPSGKVFGIKGFGSADVIVSKDFLTEVRFAHLGSIKIWSGADYFPEILYNEDFAFVKISGNPKRVFVGINARSNKDNKPVKVSGEIDNPILEMESISGGEVEAFGSSINEIDYVFENVGFIKSNGSAELKIDIEREFTGLIDVNVTSNRNFNVEPIVEGWLRTGGGIDTADFVDYGQLDQDTPVIIITSKTKYRSHGDDLLIFNEITNRRAFEAGLGDGELSYPEDTWTSLQNFNDLIDDTEDL